MPALLRTVLNLVAAFVVGLLVAWGLFEKFAAKPTSTPVSVVAAATPPAPLVIAAGTPKSADENLVVGASRSTSASASPSPGVQTNGLPLGLTQDALNYNKELYQRYPGLQPPLINTDGRDLGPEAIQKLTGPPTMLPNPGGSPPSTTFSPIPLVSPDRHAGLVPNHLGEK